MKIEIRTATNGQYYFRIVASNGEPLATSETYTTKSNAEHGAQLIKDQAGSATIVDLT